MLSKEILKEIKTIELRAKHLATSAFAGEYASVFRGQGIEFDYCCVHGLLAIKECGYESSTMIFFLSVTPENQTIIARISDKTH